MDGDQGISSGNLEDRRREQILRKSRFLPFFAYPLALILLALMMIQYNFNYLIIYKFVFAGDHLIN